MLQEENVVLPTDSTDTDIQENLIERGGIYAEAVRRWQLDQQTMVKMLRKERAIENYIADGRDLLKMD